MAAMCKTSGKAPRKSDGDIVTFGDGTATFWCKCWGIVLLTPNGDGWIVPEHDESSPDEW